MTYDCLMIDDEKLLADSTAEYLNLYGYSQKPYSLSVLLAKVRAVLKRCSKKEDASYDDGRLNVDLDARQVLVGGAPVRLTA